MTRSAVQRALDIPVETSRAQFTPHSEYGVINEDRMAALYNQNVLDPGATTHADPFIPPTSLNIYRFASKLHATGYTVSIVGEYRAEPDTTEETLAFFSVFLYDELDHILVSQLLSWALSSTSVIESPPDRIMPDDYGYRITWKPTVRHELQNQRSQQSADDDALQPS